MVGNVHSRLIEGGEVLQPLQLQQMQMEHECECSGVIQSETLMHMCSTYTLLSVQHTLRLDTASLVVARHFACGLWYGSQISIWSTDRASC